MKVIDDGAKPLKWWNRNYFFAVTVLVVVLNIVLYAVFKGRETYPSTETVGNRWNSMFNFDNMFRSFANAFSHENWQHVLLNMLCFLVYGIYLERKQGSLPFLLLIFVMSCFTSFACTANAVSVSWHGFSGVNYGFYAYVIIDYFFSLRKHKRTLFNILAGAVVIALIYLAMCFNGGVSSVGFETYPYDLMHNMGHYSSFAAGAVLAFMLQLTRLIAEKEHRIPLK